MTDFKRGDKVQVHVANGDWLGGYEYVGRVHDSSSYQTVIDASGCTWIYSNDTIRRAPRVVKQMCQWWRDPLDDALRACSLNDEPPYSHRWQKVGEPFEQTLEIPE